MTRVGALVWFVLVLAAGFATFRVKYAVQDIEDQLRRVHKQTVAEQQEIRVLTAEWTYLNQPERLAELNQRFLRLQAIATAQLRETIAALPWRSPAATSTVAVTAAQPSAPQPTAAGRATPPPAPSSPVPSVPTMQLAKAGPSRTPPSLDALIAKIAEAR